MSELIAQQARYRQTELPPPQGAYAELSPLGSDGLRKYYEHWIDRSKSSIDLPFEVRRYRSLMVALDRDEFEKLVEKINAFALELLSQHHSGEITGKDLYMLNAALFPVAGLPA